MTPKGSTPEADRALKEAEESLKAAGIPLSFSDPNQIMNLPSILPDPSALRNRERQKHIETAIDKFNIVLEELEQESGNDNSYSVSDRGLLHLHLGLSYIFDGISRLLIADEASQTFIVELTEDELYTFNVSPNIKAKLDAARKPEDSLLTFTTDEREAIMDFAYLLDGAVVRPSISNIQPQSSSVNRPPYSRYAIWHFQKAVSLFSQYDSEIQKSLRDFNSLIDKLRSVIQEKCLSWGFTYTVPPGR